MQKSMEQLTQELDAKIPREEISRRDAGQGRMLDYVSSFYVISQLNKTLGQGNWAYTSEVTKLHEGTIKDRYGNDVHTVHYSAKVRFAAKFPNGETAEFGDYGYGDGSDKINPGKAHELAIKEAVTDGLKRCAKNLGMRLGLALYDKEQENVSNDAVKEDAKPPAKKQAPQMESQRASPAQATTPSPALPALLVLIKKKSEVILERAGLEGTPERKAKLTQLKKLLTDKYGVASKEGLTAPQAEEFSKTLDTLM